MAKICILSAVNIRHMSLISLYTDILKERDIEYDIVYMDKYDEMEEFECATRYRYVNKVNQSWPRAIKAVKYMMFLPYAAKILNKSKYDFVIVWNDVAIFMFANYLAKHYKGKYCLNVRDNMGYGRPSRQKRFERVFENAAFSTISSKGYLSFLPQGIEYVPVNSLNLSVLSGMNRRSESRSASEPIRIGFVGYVRFFERNKKMLDVFANDPRFELCYFGTKADVLKEYAEQRCIRNASFHDSFPVSDTPKYLEQVDIINNLYGNETVNLRTAISIKFFHALYAHIPILVCPDTFIGDEANRVGIGYTVDEIDESMKDGLYNWYRSLDYSVMISSCDRYLEVANEENRRFRELFESYLYTSKK